MKTRRNLLIFFLLFVVTLTQAQIKLSFNPAKGSRYDYLYQTEQTTLIEVQGQNIQMGMSMYVAYDMVTKEKSKDGFILEAKYTDLGISMLSDKVSLQYDSKKPEADTTQQSRLFGKILSAMLNKPFSIHFLNDGSVTSVSGMDAISEGMHQAAGDQPELAGIFQEAFSETSMKNIFEQSFKFYPSSPIRVGDHWTVDMAFPAFGMDIRMKNNYTLQSVEKKIAQIRLTSDFDFSSVNGQGMNMSGIQSGEMKVDVKTGVPLSATLTQQIKGTQEIQGNNVKMSTESTVTFGLQEK